jgi:hypothetical protein
MKLIFLYGPPAAGKLTVANELSALTGFKVFHNHVSFDLAAAFFDFGTRGFGRVVDGVRMLLFDVAASEGVDGLIFTFVYASPGDDRFVESVIETVEGNAGEVCFVRLTCEKAVLEERVVSPERREFGKITEAKPLRRLIERWELFLPIPFRESLTVDSSLMTPDEAAGQIAAHYSLTRAAH